MSEAVNIVLLGAPRGKERPRSTKDGVVYTPEKTRSYEAALKFAAAIAMGSRPPMTGPLSVSVYVTVPIAESWSKKRKEAALCGDEMPVKKPDLDNIVKMLDALNLVVWIDDSQIVITRAEKRYGDKPGIRILVMPFNKAFIFRDGEAAGAFA